MRAVRKAAALLLPLLLTLPSTAAAQSPPVDHGDKTGGEEERILARERYFARQRGLGDAQRPDLARARAVAEVQRLRRAGRMADELAWAPLGPESMTMLGWDMGRVSGRVAALAVHPADEDVLYLGAASGGLWKSLDGGASWIAVFDDVGTQSIGVVTLDPADPDEVWVGTGEQGQHCWSYFGMGVLRSTDGGATWQPRNGSGASSLELSYVSAIAHHPTVAGLVLAGGHGYCSGGTYHAGGLFRSTDDGASWTRVLSGAVSDVLVHPTNPDVMYAGVGRWGWTSDGVYRSVDAGLTWSRLGGGLPAGAAVGRIRLAMAPGDAQVLYALVEDGGGATLYRTTDGGATWSARNASACEGQCWYDLCLAVHPTDPAKLVVGSIRHFSSADGGSTLTARTAEWGESQEVHQDTHVLVYSRSDGNRYWVAGDGGLWRTDDGGATFTNLNGNLNITQYYDIAVHPDDAATVFGGAQDNSSSRTTGSATWDVTVLTGDGFVNLVDPAAPAAVFQTSYPWSDASGTWPALLRSLSGGAPGSFDWVWPLTGIGAGESWNWVTPMAIVTPAGGASRILMASSYAYVALAASPTSWTRISGDLTGGGGETASVVTAVPSGTGIAAYIGTTDGRVHTCVGLTGPRPTCLDVTGSYPGGAVTDIAVAPGDPQRVLVTRGDFGAARLYRSTAGGTSWQPVGAGLPDVPANTVAWDPLDASRVFVGTDVGVFVSRDGGDTFAPAMTGLPLGVVVTDLEVDDDPYVLTAGTYGRGAWQAALAPPWLFADGFDGGGAGAWSASVF